MIRLKAIQTKIIFSIICVNLYTPWEITTEMFRQNKMEANL